MTVKLPELWLQIAFDDLQSAKVLLKEARKAYSYAKDINAFLRPLVKERIRS